MDAQYQPEKIEKPLSLEREFILQTVRVAKRNPIPVIISQSCIAWFAYGYVPNYLVLIWWIVAVAMIALRAVVIYKLPSVSGKTDNEKINRIAAVNLVNGLVMFSSLYFFFHIPELERAFHALIMVVLAVGTTTFNVGYKKTYLPYLILTSVSVSFALILFPALPEDQFKYYVMGGLGLMFSIILISIGNDSFDLFKGSIDLRGRYADANLKLEAALADSESSNAAKTRFLASASHDLRQPVHTLSLFTAALQSRSLDQKTSEIVHTMDRSLQILNKQLEALLDISKLDAGVVKPNINPVDTVGIFTRQREQFQPIAASKGITLSLSAPQQAVVTTDAVLFERICNNLIGNAVKYTLQGTVSIYLTAADEHLSVTIEDTGIGIEQSELDNIFEEFYQVNNPHRDKSAGLGLGLSIVRRLTDLLGVDMRLTSDVGQGTVITLQLPLHDQTEKRETNSNKQTVSFENLKVLVVDDEEDVLLASQAYLEALGCEPMLANSGVQAIELAQVNKVDLLITDLRLKDKSNGIDVIFALRDIHPHLPAIIISGDTAPDRLKEASQAEAGFLHKPIQGEALKLAMFETLNTQH